MKSEEKHLDKLLNKMGNVLPTSDQSIISRVERNKLFKTESNNKLKKKQNSTAQFVNISKK